MQSIKKTFGEDVVILSSRLVETHGKPDRNLVEITIGLDGDASSQEFQEERRSNYLQKTVAQTIELDNLDLSQNPSPYREFFLGDELSRVLQRNGIVNSVIESLIESYQQISESQGEDQFSNSLSSTLLTQAIGTLINCEETALKHRYLALVGQHGVGKTTTTCKLALRCAQKHRSAVGIISIDTERRSGTIQVEEACKAHKIPLQLASNVEELDAAFQNMSYLDRIFIDCPGVVSAEIDPSSLFAELLGVPGIAKMLLVPASGNYIDLQRNVREFLNWGIAGISITKIDDTSHFGPCFSVIAESKLPLGYFGTGRRIPEDLKLGNAAQLTELLTRTLH